MKNRYRAALAGYTGIFRGLRRVVGTRFTTIKAFVLVPAAGEKLALEVRYDQRQSVDVVTLTRHNWLDGSRCVLYQGPLTNGRKEIPPRQRE